MFKRRGFMLSFFLVLVLSSSLVFAQSDVGEGAEQVGQTIASGTAGFVKGVFSVIFDAFNGVVTTFFLSVLLFIIVYSLMGSIFSGMGKWTNIGISLMVTIVAFVGLPEGFIEGLTVQYGAMGAALLAIIPFAAILVFTIRSNSLLIARVTWIFYMVYYLGLYLDGIVNEGPTQGSIPYLTGFIAGIIMFFVVGPIRRFIWKGKKEGLVESGKQNVDVVKEDLNLIKQDFEARTQ